MDEMSHMSVANNRKETQVYWNAEALLGGAEVLGAHIKSEFDWIALSNEGLKKASLDTLVAFLGMAKKPFVEQILNMSVKTLERKKGDDRLGRHTSSHVIEIAKVVQHAVEVFEDEDKVRDWLTTPNRALNGMPPLEIFHMPTGLALVDDVLGRIEEGVYS